MSLFSFNIDSNSFKAVESLEILVLTLFSRVKGKGIKFLFLNRGALMFLSKLFVFFSKKVFL